MSRPTRGSAAGRAYLDLQNQARRQKWGTQELLTMYVVERWLSRMLHSAYGKDFILKGWSRRTASRWKDSTRRAKHLSLNRGLALSGQQLTPGVWQAGHGVIPQ